MHFFSFSSIFFHAPGVINCVFYQAEKFSEVDKTRIKKKSFFWKIYSQILEDLKSSNPVSDLHTRIAFNMIVFFFWREQFWLFLAPKPRQWKTVSKSSLQQAWKRRRKKTEEAFSPIRVVPKTPPERGRMHRTSRWKKKNPYLGGNP